MFPTRSCVRCAEPRPGWQASPKPGEYAPLPHNSLVLIPLSNSKTKLTKTARSSSASSQPRKPASSIPRSVFGRVPSWPPSSMIREVCGVVNVNVQCFLVLVPMGPKFRQMFLSLIHASSPSSLALPPPPTRAPPITSCPFFYFVASFGEGGGRACREGGRCSIPAPPERVSAYVF